MTAITPKTETPKSECPVCKDGDDIYCPVHTVIDPKAEERAKIVAYISKDFGDVRALTTTSGLFVEVGSEGESAKRKRPIAENVFIEGLWAHARAHVASYLVAIGRPSYRIVTDMQLIEMKYTRDAESTFSSAVRTAPVLVVRLGFQLSTNAELPSVVFEALRQRELEGPNAKTILVNEPFTPWRKGHKAFSEELAAYVSATFARVKIGPPKPAATTTATNKGTTT